MLCKRGSAAPSAAGTPKLWYVLATLLVALLTAIAWGTLRSPKPPAAARLDPAPAPTAPPAVPGSRDVRDAQALTSSLPNPSPAPRIGTEPKVTTDEALERACESGDTSSCRVLAKRLLYTPPYEVARARRLLEPACARGGFEDCWDLGEFLQRGGPHQDTARAAEFLRRSTQLAEAACSREEVGGCVRLAWAYRQGIGVPRDERKYNEYMLKMATLTVDQQKRLKRSDAAPR